MKPDEIPYGSWTRQSNMLPALPAAIGHLRHNVTWVLARQTRDTVRSQQLQALEASLIVLEAQKPDERCFEAVAEACHTAAFQFSEHYLVFLFEATFERLKARALTLFQQYLASECCESIAHDLAATLFTQMMEAVTDSTDPESSRRLPPVGHVLKWLHRAINNDVLDYCKSGRVRLERHVIPLQDEHYDDALDRMAGTAGGDPTVNLEASLSTLEKEERRTAFLEAFVSATEHLKPRHREALRLREVENLTLEAIAVQLNSSLQQVQDLLQYGREKRAEMLLAQLRHSPVLADLQFSGPELTALLKRVRLGSLARDLALAGPSSSSSPRLEPLPVGVMTAALRETHRHSQRGMVHARGT